MQTITSINGTTATVWGIVEWEAAVERDIYGSLTVASLEVVAATLYLIDGSSVIASLGAGTDGDTLGIEDHHTATLPKESLAKLMGWAALYVPDSAVIDRYHQMQV